MSETGAAKLPGPGDVVGGKYRLERLLGQGGMGAVYAARHLKLGNSVAIKLMLAAAGNVEATQRFLNEGRAAVHIQHENVVRGSDVDEENGYAYMVLELLDGEDLDQVLEREIRLAPHVAVGYVLQAIRGVGQAHAQGIIHRDLKPANLFLTRRADGSMLVKVLDFGISKASGGSALAMAPNQLTSTATMLGSPLYMSPEQLRSSKTVDLRADIWAFGVILYELITGERPFNGETLGELFSSILETDAVRLSARIPTIPPGLDAIVARCLQRRPDDRYQSTAELERDLAPYANAMSGGATAALPGYGAPMHHGGTAAITGASTGDRLGGVAAVTGPHAPQLGAQSSSGMHPPMSAQGGPGQGGMGPGQPMLGTVPLGAMSPHQQNQLGLQHTTGSGSAWQAPTAPPKSSTAPIIFLVACGVLAVVGGGAFALSKTKKPATPVAAASQAVPPAESSAAPPPAPSDTTANVTPTPTPTSTTSAASAPAPVAVAPNGKHHTAPPAPVVKPEPPAPTPVAVAPKPEPPPVPVAVAPPKPAPPPPKPTAATGNPQQTVR